MAKKNNNVWYILGGVIIIVIIIIIIFMNLNKNQVQEIKCEGEYIKYQGNCCLDINYNNICDSTESGNSPESEEKYYGSCSFSDLECIGQGAPTPIDRDKREICQAKCNSDIGKCVLENCKIVDCISSSDCRNGKICDQNFKCI